MTEGKVGSHNMTINEEQLKQALSELQAELDQLEG